MWLNNFASTGRPGLGSFSNQFLTFPLNPIMVIFNTPAVLVSLQGIDVGINGMQIDAYNAQSGGSLVDSDQVIGPPTAFFNPTLSLTGSSILRVEIYQPLLLTGDGVLFDDLFFQSAPVFQPVPEPSSALLWGAGLIGLGVGARRWRRRAA